jgi:hypothetical protein
MSFFTGSVPLMMLSTSLFADSSVARRWTATDMYVDPADYVKADNSSAIVAAWFEAKILDAGPAGNGLGADTLELIDDADTVVATITTDGIPGKGGVRYRVAFTALPTVAHTYRLRTGTVNYYLEVKDAQIVLDVEDAYRVKVMAAMLVAGDESTGTAGFRTTEALDNLDVWCLNNSDTTYVAGSVDYYGGSGERYTVGKWLKEASKWATVDHWTFEAIAAQFLFLGAGGAASSNGNIALFNYTSGLQVTGTELTFTPGTSRQSVDFADDATNFTDAAEFEPRFKVADTNETIGVARVILYCTLVAARKAIYIAGRVINGDEIPFNTAVLNTTGGRYYHDASKFASGTNFYYEMTGQQKGNNTPQAALNDAGTSDWGYQSALGTPTVAAATLGSWTNETQAGDDGLAGGPLASTSALFESIINGDIGQIRLSAFSFAPSIPPAASIQLVEFILRYNLEGQAAPFAVRVNGNAFHSATPAVGVGVTQQTLYDASADAVWIPGDFTNPNVDVKVTHPANVVDTKWWINGGQLVVGWSDQLTGSALSFTATVRVRQRTAALTLTDGHRYTAIHPGSNTSTNKVLHSNGVILAEVVTTGADDTVQTTSCPCDSGVGTIYEMSSQFPDDDGCTKVWLRRAPHVGDEQQRISHHKLQVLFEHGRNVQQGEDPQAMLRWSNDYGQQWSNEHWRPIGKIGEYRKRTIWRRLGQARNRVYELRGAGNVSIVNAFLQADEDDE